MPNSVAAVGLAFLRQRAGQRVRAIALGVAAQAALVVCLLVAAGFLTAAGTIWLASTHGIIAACLIVAAIYLFVGLAAFTILMSLKPALPDRPPLSAQTRPGDPVAQLQALAGSTGLTGIAVMLVVGYLLGNLPGRRN